MPLIQPLPPCRLFYALMPRAAAMLFASAMLPRARCHATLMSARRFTIEIFAADMLC